MTKGRMEAFSDGVFAIVITLLILEIHLPEGVPPEQLAESLWELVPSFGAYILSFFVVGLYWVVHHRYMHLIRVVNGPLLWINLIWLLFVSAMPFPTSLVGGYPLEVLPVIIYGTNLILANVTGFLAVLYVRYHPELAAEPVTGEYLRMLAPRYIGTNGLYAVGIGLAWVSPVLSEITFALVLMWLVYQYFVDPRRPVRA